MADLRITIPGLILLLAIAAGLTACASPPKPQTTSDSADQKWQPFVEFGVRQQF
jgi:hypothetical protein